MKITFANLDSTQFKNRGFWKNHKQDRTWLSSLVEAANSSYYSRSNNVCLKHFNKDGEQIICCVIKLYNWLNCKRYMFRSRSCEAAFNLLSKFKNSYQSEVKIIDESYEKLNSIPPVQVKETIDLTKVRGAGR